MFLRVQQTLNHFSLSHNFQTTRNNYELIIGGTTINSAFHENIVMLYQYYSATSIL